MFSLANSEAINKAATMSSREVADLTGSSISTFWTIVENVRFAQNSIGRLFG